MSKHKTVDLDGDLLDAAVAVASGYGDSVASYSSFAAWASANRWSPSTQWLDGGPIIEREFICLEERRLLMDEAIGRAGWMAYTYNDPQRLVSLAETPLKAAMRLYVRQKFGDEVELP